MIPRVCGEIFACRFICDADIGVVSTDAGTTMNIEKAHRLLGYGDKESTRQTVKHLNWVITRGALEPCLSCTMAKAKQKNVTKASTTPKADEP